MYKDKEKQKQYYRDNKEIIILKHIQYRKDHRVEVNNRQKLYRKEIKQRCVDYLGGKCKECGYNECLAALDFHHIDPNTKEFSIAQIRTNTWETIKEELDKCIVLCANHHRKLHWDDRAKKSHEKLTESQKLK